MHRLADMDDSNCDDRRRPYEWQHKRW